MSGGNMIQNYKEFKEYLQALTYKPKLLVHACCGPCSTHCLRLLQEYFEITVLFSNSNIDTKEEFELRYEELMRVIDSLEGIHVVNAPYQHHQFLEYIKGLEYAGERSNRCYHCYELRLEETCVYAKKHAFDFFTTTISISPHKNSTWINEIGYRLAEHYQMPFLYSDFKKENGYQASIQISKELALYRQEYCGCEFSKNERKETNHENKH